MVFASLRAPAAAQSENPNSHSGFITARLLRYRHLLSKLRRLPGPPRISGNGSHSFRTRSKENTRQNPQASPRTRPPITKTARSLDRAFILSFSKLTAVLRGWFPASFAIVCALPLDRPVRVLYARGVV